MDDRFGDRPNSFVMPAYARVDMAASYVFTLGGNELTAQVNVSNLFDERYFVAADGRPAFARISTTPGAPRSVTASARVGF